MYFVTEADCCGSPGEGRAFDAIFPLVITHCLQDEMFYLFSRVNILYTEGFCSNFIK